MRLAVTSATQPFANRMRALAMSISSVNTGAPIASIEAIGERTMCSIRSMSWIMRSSTTETSVPRGLNGASRFDSMKRGLDNSLATARITGLKRSRWPTCSTQRRSAAIAMSSRASSAVAVIGFSTRTWTPACRKSHATG